VKGFNWKSKRALGHTAAWHASTRPADSPRVRPLPRRVRSHRMDHPPYTAHAEKHESIGAYTMVPETIRASRNVITVVMRFHPSRAHARPTTITFYQKPSGFFLSEMSHRVCLQTAIRPGARWESPSVGTGQGRMRLSYTCRRGTVPCRLSRTSYLASS
jgi:hypothetical protein